MSLKSQAGLISQDDLMKLDSRMFDGVYNSVLEIKNQESIREFEINAKAKKLQRWVQKRFSKWLKLMFTLFKTKIRNKEIVE